MLSGIASFECRIPFLQVKKIEMRKCIRNGLTKNGEEENRHTIVGGCVSPPSQSIAQLVKGRSRCRMDFIKKNRLLVASVCNDVLNQRRRIVIRTVILSKYVIHSRNSFKIPTYCCTSCFRNVKEKDKPPGIHGRKSIVCCAHRWISICF